MQGRTRRGLRQALNVGIVGGSLGGLTAALVLRDLGCEVEVAERSTAELESRGAGIVVLPETSRYLSERTNGDAAFVVRPHIAAGTAKAAADAWALADALGSSDMEVERALLQWEARQLAVGRAALERARRNGDRSQFHGTWTPGDPDLDYGLMPGS